MRLGESPAALHEKGLPCPPFPPKSLVLSVLAVCVYVSVWISEPPQQVLHLLASPKASLNVLRLPGTEASWFKAIGSSASISTLLFLGPFTSPHVPSFPLPFPFFRFFPFSFISPAPFSLLPGSYAVIYIFVLSLSSCGDNLVGCKFQNFQIKPLQDNLVPRFAL